MSGTNMPAVGGTTHGGAPAPLLTPIQELRRTVLSCLLWEDTHYENGQSIAARIAALVPTCSPNDVPQLAIEARREGHLRHVPLYLVRELARTAKGRVVGDTLAEVIQRPDEITEFLALYWKEGKCPLSKQVKVGLARAFRKFDAYQFAKYDRGTTIKLRDVLFLVHGKPKTSSGKQTKYQRPVGVDGLTADELLYKQIVDRTLPIPDTWETATTGKSEDQKKEEFERLLREGKLGYTALLKNLRKMQELGVNYDLITQAIEARRGAKVVLPFQFFVAAREAPAFEQSLDRALGAQLQEAPRLSGKTLIILDVSGSMHYGKLSKFSTISLLQAGACLAALVRGQCENAVVYATAGHDYTRQHATKQIPARQGFSLVDALVKSAGELGGGGIFLKPMLDWIKKQEQEADRIIVITDEQDCAVDQRDNPALAVTFGKRNYLINIANYKYGVGYGSWTHIDGFSENTVKFICELENGQ